MEVEAYFNVGPSVGIHFRGNKQLLDEINLHLDFFKCASLDGPADILIETYNARPNFEIETVVDDYEFGEGCYHRAAIEVQMNMRDAQQSYYLNRLHIPINLMIQIALLKKEYSFIHGAAVAYRGENLLFPAYPGTGKTTTLSGLMHEGAKLFGDDLCIIGNGTIYPFPQCFSVYRHHLPILRYDNKKLDASFRKSRRINKIIEKLPFKYSLPTKAVRLLLNTVKKDTVNLDPREVFGDDCVAEPGSVSKVLFLERGNVSSLEPMELAVDDAAALATTVLLHEWHASFHDLLLYDALSSSGRWLSSIFEQVERIIATELANAPLSMVKIPASWDNKILVQEFPKFLSSQNSENKY